MRHIEVTLFKSLEKINHRPEPWSQYTAKDLWDDDYVSGQMLNVHLNPDVDLASRNHAFIEKSAAWIAERFDLGPEKSVCDFGCGPGLYTTRFARTGASVAGVDFSRNSIGYASQKALEEGLGIQYHLGNYLDFTSQEKFDLITMIYVDFCPLSPDQRQKLIGTIREHLSDDGCFFMDVLTLNYFDKAEEERSYEYSPENGFWSSDPYYAFLNTWKYSDINLILGKHTVVEEERTREIYNWLQCYDKESLSKEFEKGGMTIVEEYSNVAGNPYDEESTEMALVVKRS